VEEVLWLGLMMILAFEGAALMITTPMFSHPEQVSIFPVSVLEHGKMAAWTGATSRIMHIRIIRREYRIQGNLVREYYCFLVLSRGIKI
jgi:hypothetical protein